MKIACIGYLHGAGGAERQIIMLANALYERGHEVHLISLVATNIDYEMCAGVIVHDLSFEENITENKILNRYKTLKNILMEIKPEVTVNYWLQSTYFCAMMSKSITGKVIYSERGDPGNKEYSGLLGIVRKLAFERVDGFVFQSEGARNYFGEKIKRKSTVIHNSVSIPDDMFLEPCINREKKIVTVGRLHPQKNQKLLIDAFAKIADDFPEYRLDIYGDGETEELLKEQIERLGLKNRVFLRGTKKNILDYVYTASVFVLSSNYEGLPNALMEAIAIGVPCISTDCKPGGARTLIQDGINGWIVPKENVTVLAEKMQEVILGKKENEMLKKEAIKFRQAHSSKEVFDMWEKYILNL